MRARLVSALDRAWRGSRLATALLGLGLCLSGLVLPSSAAIRRPSTLTYYLHTGAAEVLDRRAPTSATPAIKDSPPLGTAYQEIGRWTARPGRIDAKLHLLKAVHLWIGTPEPVASSAVFGLRVELLRNGVVLAAGENPSLPGALLKASQGRETLVPLSGKGRIDIGDVLTLRVLGRVRKLGRVSGAPPSSPQLRLFYDSASQPAGFAAIASVENTQPVAKAGPDQTVAMGAPVTLDGSGSTDADGHPLTFAWTMVGRPAGSTATLSSATAVKPTFTVDRAGSYTVELVVHDGKVASGTDTVVVSTLNSRPLANAGPDQTTFVGRTVTLDGSGSSDVDGDSLTYHWSLVGRPAGSGAALDDPGSVTPTFVADVFGEYAVDLIVSDGVLESVADTVSVSTLNSPPVAQAGPHQTGFVGDTVTLDGSGSTDVDGNPLVYAWAFTTKPPGSAAALSDPTAVKPSYAIDRFGDYVVQLIVNDGAEDSVPATVTVSTLNSPPVANAGPDRLVFVGDLVLLNGSGSTDVDGNALTFTWALTTRPSGSGATLSSTTAVTSAFTVDVPGTYIAQLSVHDGAVGSAPDTVRIDTQNRSPVAHAGLDQTVAVGATVQLTGGGSADPDTDALMFAWSILAKPAGSAAALSDATAANPTFVVDERGDYVVQLIVNDGAVDSAPDTVTLSTENSVPVADAGPDHAVVVGATVELDGRLSMDPDGTALQYFWAITVKPAASAAVLSDPSAVIPSFVADVVGTYLVQLIVSDEVLTSAPDTAMVTAGPLTGENHAPVAEDDRALTAEDTPVEIDALANDSDPDEDALTITTVTQGASGAVTHTATAVTYTPNPGFHGLDSFTYRISDGRGGLADASVRVEVDRVPQVDAGPDQTITLPAGATLAGSIVDDGLPAVPGVVTATWSQVSGPGTVTFAAPSAVSATASFSEAGTYVLRLTGTDGFLSAFDEVQIAVNPAAGGPGLVPAPVNPSVATNVFDATKFLYTGPEAVQTGVAAGAIVARRAGVVRGRVLDRDDAALPGVTIAILGHPELGQTESRADGMFDMVVNAGGALTVTYGKAGYLPAQRQVNALWQGFVTASDVVLIPRDPEVTAIDLTAGVMQVARARMATDGDGSRRATLVIPAGTQAEVLLPGGGTQPVSTLSVRMTEYTVGPKGPETMPAPLPATSAYTYALEISADESVAKIAGRDVLLSQPVFHYVENFLGFPAGTTVPIGYYDNDRAVWVPSANGRVIRITGATNGLADVDTVGSGALPPLALSDAERQQLAALYAPGQSLWRTPITHFSTWDLNWPYGPPGDATAPSQPPPSDQSVDQTVDEGMCESTGNSVIECQNQILGESVAIVGTPFALNYRSDRVPGWVAARTVTVQASGPTVPTSLKRIEVRLTVAGQSLSRTLAPLPNQRVSFSWDGRDAYGRQVQGNQSFTGSIGYVYDAVYYGPSPGLAAFGQFGRAALGGNPARQEFTIAQGLAGRLGALDARGLGLGGWTLGVHHAYDPAGQMVFLGAGRRQRGQSVAQVISTLVPFVNLPSGVAAGPDGSVYFTEGSIFARVHRMRPDGTLQIVAGTGVSGFGGDGGLATQALLNSPAGVAVGPDGSIYIADTSNHRIRKVGPDGTITTVAGSAVGGTFAGDDGPATLASLNNPQGVAVGPDGSLYIADTGNNRVRRVGPDGIITTC